MNLSIDFSKFDKIITIEDNAIKGGFGSSILEFSQEHNFLHKTIKTLGIPDHFLEHGTMKELFNSISLDEDTIKKTILNYL